jgi:uncharacterized damage-inducible protein DinB
MERGRRRAVVEKEIFEMLGEYNKSSNVQMNRVIHAISDEEWDAQFPSFWKSIHELCSHIFIGDYGRIKFLNSFSHLNFFPEHYFDTSYKWEEIIFESKNEYFARRKELDDVIIEFIHEITNDDINTVLKTINWKDEAVENKFGSYLLHMFNHGTHHRAIVSLYLDMLGKEHDFTVGNII